jgi:hypothetical protein
MLPLFLGPTNKPRDWHELALLAGFLLGLFFDPEDGGIMFPWRICYISEDRTLHSHNLRFVCGLFRIWFPVQTNYCDRYFVIFLNLLANVGIAPSPLLSTCHSTVLAHEVVQHTQLVSHCVKYGLITAKFICSHKYCIKRILSSYIPSSSFTVFSYMMLHK